MAASSAASSFQRGERRGRWGSPERTMVWTEPKPKPRARPRNGRRTVAVVYYLCHRNGQLEHPHFLEMDLITDGGLYLRDFTGRLNALRGNGMATMYSWSSKRSYKNGFVWHDLAEDDLIHPAHADDEYVLKGSQLVLFPPPPPTSSTSSSQSQGQGRRSPHANDRAGHKNWSSFDLGDCSNVVALRTGELSAADDDRRPDDPSTELAIDEISPPPSSSSPDTLETPVASSREVGVLAGGRMRASAVLMQLFSCGSVPVKRDPMVSGSSHGRGYQRSEKQQVADARAECLSGGGGGMAAMDRERDCFSGSLVESSKARGGERGDDALLLKRSSSCNADRAAVELRLPLPTKEADSAAGCLRRKPSTQ